MKSAPQVRRERVLQRLALVVLALFVVTLQVAYLWNAIRWTEAPDRGWIAMIQLGPTVVAQARPLGYQAGLRDGDVILELNGQSFETFEELWEVLDSEIGNDNVYSVQRGNEVLTFAVENQPLGFERVAMQSGIFWLLGVLISTLGFLVFGMKPFHAPSWAFLVMTVLLGVMVPHFAPSHHVFEPEFLNNVVIFIVPLMPASLITLAMLFPQRKQVLLDRKRWLFLPYGISLVLAVVSRMNGIWVGFLPPRLLSLIYLYVLASVVIFLGSAGYDYYRTKLVAVRLQSLVILTGITLAFLVPVVELVSNLILKTSLFPNLIAVYALCLLFFPLSIGYAIARHDLFEISTVVRRTYGYMLSTAVVITAYGSALTVLDLSASPQVADSPLVSVAFLLAVAFSFEPIHRRSQGFVDRIFYRQSYDYRKTIRQVTETMTTILDPPSIHRALLGTLVDEMLLENGVLLLPDESTKSYRLERVHGSLPDESPTHVGFDDPLVELLASVQNPLFRHDIDLNPSFARDRETLQAQFSALGAEAVILMTYESKPIGLISLGQKKSGKMFTHEDLDLIRTLTSQTAIALQNARLFDELAGSLKQVRMLETIKANLAKFVPQTVQNLIEESPDEAFDKREADLTVMFADMTGYTRLSAHLPMFEVNEIIERYFGAFLDEILRYGGDVNETAGDGLMVLFQDKDPEQHARSAVRAALAIQRLTQEINAERRAKDPECLEVGMHIGANSGIASVGATKIQGGGGSRWTYTASGPTTNLAARVGALGELDWIAVTDETRQRLGDLFELDAMGPQTLKNVKESVPTFRVLAEKTLPGAEASPSAKAAPVPAATIMEPEPQAEPNRFKIVGRVRESGTGRPLPDLLVRAFDRDLVYDDYLGEARSDADGRFVIVFREELFSHLFETQPDIYLHIFDAAGQKVASSENAIRWNAGRLENFEFEIEPTPT